MNSILAGLVAARRNDASLAAADDYRTLRQLRFVTDFDRGVEGVAVEVGDAEIKQLVMTNKTFAATRWTIMNCVNVCSVETIAAKIGHISD